jgi:hypothetical protein
MIVTNIIGGLGNQFFQYAMGAALAAHHQVPLKIDASSFAHYQPHRPRVFALELFQAPLIHATESEIKLLSLYQPPAKAWQRWWHKQRRLHKKKPASFVREKVHYYVDDSLFALKPPLYLDGYWQAYPHLEPIADDLRRWFTLKEPASGENAALLATMAAQQSVAVHVRRGDYINHNYSLCSVHYYQQAVRAIRQRFPAAVFYGFSDDPDWIAEHLNDVNIQIVRHNPETAGHEDLRLMAACKHQIIANSTLSWWAAWLNSNPDKTVFAPQGWLLPDKDTKALLPEHWIQMANS